MIVAVAIVTVSCGKTNGDKAKFDKNTQLVLNAENGVRAFVDAPYTNEEIVSYAWETGMTRTDRQGQVVKTRRTVPIHDIPNLKLRIGQMEDVVTIDSDGEPMLGWIVTSEVHDVVLLAGYHEDESKGWTDAYKWFDLAEGGPFSNKRDTIGYVPNSVVREAVADITEAFNLEDYDECMRLFEEAYTFKPITGAGYALLREQGLN